METITTNTVSIKFEGKKYTLPDDMTLGKFLVTLGLSEDTSIKMTMTKEGFLLVPRDEN